MRAPPAAAPAPPSPARDTPTLPEGWTEAMVVDMTRGTHCVEFVDLGPRLAIPVRAIAAAEVGEIEELAAGLAGREVIAADRRERLFEMLIVLRCTLEPVACMAGLRAPLFANLDEVRELSAGMLTCLLDAHARAHRRAYPSTVAVATDVVVALLSARARAHWLDGVRARASTIAAFYGVPSPSQITEWQAVFYHRLIA